MKKLKPKSIKIKNNKGSLEIFMQVDENNKAGYIRFGSLDEDGDEISYLGAIDRNEKSKLKKIQKFINDLIKEGKP